MRAGGRGRWLATWLLLGASLAGALLYVGMRVVAPSDGGRIAFYDDAWSAAGIAIAPIDPPQPDLEDGDRVESIAGRSMDAWARLVLDPAVARPTGDPVPYIVARDGVQAPIDVVWAPPPIGATLAAGWSVILFSIAIAGVAALVFWRRPDVPAATALVIVASGVAGSSVPWYLGTTTSDVALGGPFLFHALLTAVLYMVTWPAAVHLGLVFPSRRSRGDAPAALVAGGLRGRAWRHTPRARRLSRLTTPSTARLDRHVATRPARGRRPVPARLAGTRRPGVSRPPDARRAQPQPLGRPRSA